MDRYGFLRTRGNYVHYFTLSFQNVVKKLLSKVSSKAKRAYRLENLIIVHETSYQAAFIILFVVTAPFLEASRGAVTEIN